jgi:hypothetical protein
MSVAAPAAEEEWAAWRRWDLACRGCLAPSRRPFVLTRHPRIGPTMMRPDTPLVSTNANCSLEVTPSAYLAVLAAGVTLIIEARYWRRADGQSKRRA